MQKRDIRHKQTVLSYLSHMSAIDPDGKKEVEKELKRLSAGYEKAKNKPTGTAETS